jgi:hypothetical protein
MKRLLGFLSGMFLVMGMSCTTEDSKKVLLDSANVELVCINGHSHYLYINHNYAAMSLHVDDIGLPQGCYGGFNTNNNDGE